MLCYKIALFDCFYMVIYAFQMSFQVSSRHCKLCQHCATQIALASSDIDTKRIVILSLQILCAIDTKGFGVKLFPQISSV